MVSDKMAYRVLFFIACFQAVCDLFIHLGAFRIVSEERIFPLFPFSPGLHLPDIMEQGRNAYLPVVSVLLRPIKGL